MTGWIIAFVILFLLAILPLGAHVRYDADGTVVKLIVGPVRWRLIPKKPKKPKKEKNVQCAEKPESKPEIKPKKERKKMEPAPAAEVKPESAEAHQEKPEKKGGKIQDFWPFVQLAGRLLNHFRWKLLIRRLDVDVVLGGSDPADLAIKYGRLNGVIGSLNPWLERNFRIRQRDLWCSCDFTTDQTLMTADAAISLSLGHLLWMVLKYGVLALLELIKLKNKRNPKKAVQSK